MGRALKLKVPSPSTSPAAFFNENKANPTDAEAALVALALTYGAAADKREWWITTVLKEAMAHGKGDGTGWSPPNCGDWKRPAGGLQALVASTFSTVDSAVIYADALARFGTVTAAPKAGSITKWWSLLQRGKLKVWRPQKALSRTPFIFMKAAHLLSTRDAALRAALRFPEAPRTRQAAAVSTEAAAAADPYVLREDLELAQRKINELEAMQQVRHSSTRLHAFADTHPRSLPLTARSPLAGIGGESSAGSISVQAHAARARGHQRGAQGGEAAYGRGCQRRARCLCRRDAAG